MIQDHKKIGKQKNTALFAINRHNIQNINLLEHILYIICDISQKLFTFLRCF